MNNSIQCAFSKESQRAIFQYADVPDNELRDMDVEVEVLAISLNPVDYKVASSIKNADSQPKTLGWDVAGKIKRVGKHVTNFSVGDEVYYAGDITRPGGNTKFHAIDSRLIAKKPKNLTFTEAAALPLTALTAWEGLFEGLALNAEQSKGKSLLVIGGAGGVGSMVIQLAKRLTQLKVIATSSREDSTMWCKKMGADEVINYKDGLQTGLKKIGVSSVDYIFCTNNTASYFDQFAQVTNPFGKIVSIVEVDKPVNISLLMSKSISFAWEFMFTRSMFQTDMKKQGEILNQITDLIEKSKIISTINNDLGSMTPENLEKGHALLRQGSAIGKIVLGALK